MPLRGSSRPTNRMTGAVAGTGSPAPAGRRPGRPCGTKAAVRVPARNDPRASRVGPQPARRRPAGVSSSSCHAVCGLARRRAGRGDGPERRVQAITVRPPPADGGRVSATSRPCTTSTGRSRRCAHLLQHGDGARSRGGWPSRCGSRRSPSGSRCTHTSPSRSTVGWPRLGDDMDHVPAGRQSAARGRPCSGRCRRAAWAGTRRRCRGDMAVARRGDAPGTAGTAGGGRRTRRPGARGRLPCATPASSPPRRGTNRSASRASAPALMSGCPAALMSTNSIRLRRTASIGGCRAWRSAKYHRFFTPGRGW